MQILNFYRGIDMEDLTMSEFGRRIGKCHTTVAKLIAKRIIVAKIDPLTGRKVIEESQVDRYREAFKVYDPPELQSSQPLQSLKPE